MHAAFLQANLLESRKKNAEIVIQKISLTKAHYFSANSFVLEGKVISLENYIF